MPNPPRSLEWGLNEHRDAYHAGLVRHASRPELKEPTRLSLWLMLWNDRNNWPEMAEVREILEQEQ